MLYVIEWAAREGYRACSIRVSSETEAMDIMHSLPTGYSIHTEESI